MHDPTAATATAAATPLVALAHAPRVALAVALRAAPRARVVAVLPEAAAAADAVDLLRAVGADIVRTPAQAHPASPESAIATARRIARDARDAALVDPDPRRDCFDPLLREVAAQLAAGTAVAAVAAPVDSPRELAALADALAAAFPGAAAVGVTLSPEIARAVASAPMPAGASLELVSLRDACLAARRAMRESGLLCGIESGAAIVAATRHAPARDSAVAVAVAVLGDSALRHRSTLLNDTWLLENDIYDEHMHAQLGHKYRGASVEDLQLPEALCIFETQPVSDAMDMMVSRDYSQLPVINAARKVVGLVSLGKLSADLDSGDLVDLSEPIAGRMYSFARNSEPYRIISPTTPLTDLEAFFERHPAAIVTDESAKFPLAVVTKLDLMRFLAKRGVEP